MGMTQRIIAVAVFVVRSLSAWLRSLMPTGTAPPAGSALALAQAHDGQDQTTAPTPTLVQSGEAPEQHIHLPKPTIWPAVIAFGTTLFGFGVMSSRTFAICGVIILLIGVGGWIEELRHA